MTTNTSLEDIYVCCKDDISILASFLSRILAIMDLVTKSGLTKWSHLSQLIFLACNVNYYLKKL